MTSMPTIDAVYEALRDAIFDGNTARVKELLQEHAQDIDVDYMDPGGQTLLHLASFWGRSDIVKVLLAKGANTKAKNSADCTALDLATHWGHTVVAELLKQRGGASVWEVKVKQLQTEREALRIRVEALEESIRVKDERNADLEKQIQDWHRQFEEEKSAHGLTASSLAEVQLARQELVIQVANVSNQLEHTRDLKDAALIAQSKAEVARDQMQRERDEAIEHRNDALKALEASVTRQNEITYDWRRAETAAVMADSQRNVAFIERDRTREKLQAALGDVVCLTSRLDVAENELMRLKMTLAEPLFELRREDNARRRLERALEAAPSQRPVTVMPVMDHKPRKTRVGRKEEQNEVKLEVVKPRDQYSLAAREFGRKVREEEMKKKKNRKSRLDTAEARFLAKDNGGEEEEGVTTVVLSNMEAFEASQHEKWATLEKDRFHQRRSGREVSSKPFVSAIDGHLPNVHG